MRFPAFHLVSLAVFLVLPSPAPAQEPPKRDLKKLSIEELLQIQVTSVSRKIERVSDAAAAIEVITSEDIRRAGFIRLPDILRLASGVQVAQSNGNTWAISARGFNTTAGDKLLVLIDGRTVYSPLFSGTFWDAQDVQLPDIDRIEIIRGPGATLWGANAVNGVINIITKTARETQGGLMRVGIGNETLGFGNVRYGGRIGQQTYYRAYSKYRYHDSLALDGGASAHSPLRSGQAGFRTDWEDTSKLDSITVQGDAYRGLAGQPVLPDTDFSGGNVLARWSRILPKASTIQLQAYYDRTHRNSPTVFGEERDTFDLDFQHQVPVTGVHNLVWGAGYRITADSTRENTAVRFNPARRSSPLYSAFIEDDIQSPSNRFLWTIGTKFEHNDYSGFEYQPNIRVAWLPREDQTVWASIARAVRMPTRLDSDAILIAPPLAFLGTKSFKSETVLAYEAGYRMRPRPGLSLDITTFYNVYDTLRSQEPQPPTNATILLENKLNARTYGAELIADYQVTSRWRVRAGYDYLGKRLHLDSGSRDPTGGVSEGNDPQNRFLVRSYTNLPRNFEADATLRFMGRLPSPFVPRYFELDVHFGWSPQAAWELAIVGQNLIHGEHPEFGVAGPLRQEVQRSIYGSMIWRF